jgi:hypothetical protein
MGRNSRNKDEAALSDLLHLNDDTKLHQLQAELAAAQEQHPGAQALVDAANAALREATDAEDRAESKFLAGRIGEDERARVHAAHEDARRAQALAQAALEDTERLLHILPAALEERRQVALTAIRDNLRTAVAAKLAQLAAMVRQAQALNEEVASLQRQAQTELDVPGLLRLEDGSLQGVLDLGEQGGFLGQGGGIAGYLVSPWLSNPHAPNQPSLADAWLRGVDAYLAISPAERAEVDRDNRIKALAMAKRRKAEIAASELAREALRKQVAARYGIPLSQVLA